MMFRYIPGKWRDIPPYSAIFRDIPPYSAIFRDIPWYSGIPGFHNTRIEVVINNACSFVDLL
jgi:hypothetical protein